MLCYLDGVTANILVVNLTRLRRGNLTQRTAFIKLACEHVYGGIFLGA